MIVIIKTGSQHLLILVYINFIIMLTDKQKEIILSTVPLLRSNGVVLTTHFYHRLFTHHPELKNLFNMGNQHSGKQQTALAMAVLAYAENISNPEVLMPAIDLIGHKHTSLNIKPEQYDIVGTHLLASIKEVLQELATNEVLEAWQTAYGQLAQLMIGHEAKMYDYKKQQKGHWLGWKSFIVDRKIQESKEITSFYLIPEDGSELPNFIPGQYISVQVYLPKLKLTQIRQYSISCAPNNDYLRISVKRERNEKLDINGMISNYLHDEIHEGQTLTISSPAGNFTLQNKFATKIFISGGIGQTPLMSMLEHLAQNSEDDNKLIWIHACRNLEVRAFGKKIDAITQKNQQIEQHQFYEVINETLDNPKVYKGMLDFTKIKNWHFEPDAEYYICGPKPFIEKTVKDLTEHHIKEQHIYYEEFGPKSI